MKTSVLLSVLALTIVMVGAALFNSPDVASGVGLVGAMAVVQSTYSEGMASGVPGMPANMTNWNADTRTCETSAGIGFGLPVGQGTADKGAVLAGALNLFVGVSVKDITLINETADEYALGQNMGVMTKGDIWVQPSVAVTPADPVHYNATTGAWLITGGSGPIVGARWMTSAGINGMAQLRLTGHLPVA